ncbi:ribonucleoside-diphosphate reductase, adenosylcobalamin-dependent, partial [Mangrovimonas sp. AS39]|nr:ribonucleoside-diphosphate reductase, adenosylcobalamin-dependent [Mangrovimonas futianensis]
TGANVSLRITDEFMAAVENNSTFIQQWPIDSQEPKVTQVINARELWDEIVDCAQKRGDPGLLMWDNITRNLPSEFYKGFESLSTNPSLRGDTKVW